MYHHSSIYTRKLLCVRDSRALPVLYSSYSTVYVEECYTAQHMVTMIVLAFITHENKAGKIQ